MGSRRPPGCKAGLPVAVHVLNVQIPVESGHVRMFIGSGNGSRATIAKKDSLPLDPACAVLAGGARPQPASRRRSRHRNHPSTTRKKLRADQIVPVQNGGASLRHRLPGFRWPATSRPGLRFRSPSSADPPRFDCPLPCNNPDAPVLCRHGIFPRRSDLKSSPDCKLQSTLLTAMDKILWDDRFSVGVAGSSTTNTGGWPNSSTSWGLHRAIRRKRGCGRRSQSPLRAREHPF